MSDPRKERYTEPDGEYLEALDSEEARALETELTITL